MRPARLRSRRLRPPAHSAIGGDATARMLGRRGSSTCSTSTAFTASFSSPASTAEHHPDLLREMVARGHEVGHHGYLHERPDFVGQDEEERILIRGTRILESITGKRPRGYRSPAWELKPTSPALLKRYGFVYDSSLMGDDEPYLIPAGKSGETLIEIPDPVDQRRLAALRLLLDPRPRHRHLQPAESVRDLVRGIRRLPRVSAAATS